jgi:predicted transposase/invertase (TIGR01784 family)
MTNDTLTFEDVLMEAGLIPKWLEQGREKGRQEGRREGREKGREEGRREGREKGREEVARNLLKKGWSVEETAEAAELPVERVRSLCLGMNE